MELIESQPTKEKHHGAQSIFVVLQPTLNSWHFDNWWTPSYFDNMENCREQAHLNKMDNLQKSAFGQLENQSILIT